MLDLFCKGDDQMNDQVPLRLKLNINRTHAPSTWIHLILESAKGKSSGIVTQHLIGAKLEKRHTDVEVANFPSHAAK